MKEANKVISDSSLSRAGRRNDVESLHHNDIKFG